MTNLMDLRSALAVAMLVCHSWCVPGVLAQGSIKSPDSIFQATNIWTVHLIFTPEQWAKMEPEERSRTQPRSPGSGSFLQGPEGGRNGIIAAFGVTFDYVRADLEFGPARFKDVGVRYKGNGTFMSSRNTVKRSLKIDLNESVKGQKLAGMPQINLHNAVRDPSSMNEAIAYRLFRAAGVPAPRTAYAKVFVTVAGEHDKRYFGLYTLVEDIGKPFAEEWFKSDRGAILKPVTPSVFGDLGDDWKSYNQTYDPKGSLSAEQKQRIVSFAKFVTHTNDADFAAGLGDFLDLDNFARYMALTVWLSDLDGILGPGQNYYVYLHPISRKFMFIPWDQDQTFGQFPRGSSSEQRENLSIHKPWSGENRFLERVFKADQFKSLYLARLKEFNDTVLKPQTIRQYVDELAGVLRPPIEEESPARLVEYDKATKGEVINISMGPAGFSGTAVKPIKAFVEPRSQSVRDQLSGSLQGETISSGFGFGPPRGRPGPPRQN
jgi:spore coat protein H